jgi:hypothetical protein
MIHSGFPEKEMKSRSGSLILFNGNPITWLSRRQPLTWRMTEEAQEIAVNEEISAICWIRK